MTTPIPQTRAPAPDPPAGRVRLLYVVSSPVPWAVFPWIARGLDRDRFDLSFVLPNIGPAPLEPLLRAEGVAVRYLPLGGRLSPMRAALEVARHCREHAIEIVHVHMERAGFPGLVGAWLAGVPVRIHTRHIAGPYPRSYRRRVDSLHDRRNNWLSTAIIAPTELTRRALVELDGVDPAKVTVIPHGFDMDALGGGTAAEALRMRAKYGLGDDSPIVGVVARFLAIKGIADTIGAFRKLLETYPRARLVLANARGRQEQEVRRLLRETVPGRFTEIVFEVDMPALYRTFDAIVHVPIAPHYESFGQVYVESMAARVPGVFTMAGVATEILRDGENALVVPPRRPDLIHGALLRLLGDPGLGASIAAEARRSVEDRFSLSRMLRAHEDTYLRLHHLGATTS
jgi:glycosyltransferase involved in cell wall biosynthesis